MFLDREFAQSITESNNGVLLGLGQTIRLVDHATGRSGYGRDAYKVGTARRENPVAGGPDVGVPSARIGTPHGRKHVAGHDGPQFIHPGVIARCLLGDEETHAADNHFVPAAPPRGEPKIEVDRIARLFEHEEVAAAPCLWNVRIACGGKCVRLEVWHVVGDRIRHYGEEVERQVRE